MPRPSGTNGGYPCYTPQDIADIIAERDAAEAARDAEYAVRDAYIAAANVHNTNGMGHNETYEARCQELTNAQTMACP